PLLTGVEAEWTPDDGTYKLYENYYKEIAGDNIGYRFCYDDLAEGEQITVQIGVSFVSTENAWENLEAEQKGKDFDQIHAAAVERWNSDLGRIRVEGGTKEQQTIFYTALYHALIHPSTVSDVNGEYPKMESAGVGKSDHTRYTVFSLWDTYRNLHQLLTLVYPERQTDMLRTMIGMYDEWGWLPRWELYGRETYVMSGDPAIPVIVDTWLRGLKDFDVETAYEAMIKSATTPGKDNLLRPDCDPYNEKGYIPYGIFAADLSGDNSVSRSLEYYVADYALSQLAKDLGKEEDAKFYYNRSLGYKKYYCKEFGTLRPVKEDGTFLSPFNPKQGENFEASPGFHEGTAWNYTFYVPHDIQGLAKIMGGKKKLVDKLQMVFDEKLYDPANEPNIAYPYIFSAFNGEGWRTDKEVRRLLATHFTNTPDGIPGNDDTGTMSAWAVFNMIGFYPDCPAKAEYTAVAPIFDKITLTLDKRYYNNDKVVIATEKCTPDANTISCIKIDGKKISGRKLTHEQIVNAKEIKFVLVKK
ncbi:MAG: glycoside hydrolase family 92 protein, partial [Muribaculaceae bacterium]|nr:glycoside hydrolase family 92 protein [Muribaculaceae bacterium]